MMVLDSFQTWTRSGARILARCLLLQMLALLSLAACASDDGIGRARTCDADGIALYRCLLGRNSPVSVLDGGGGDDLLIGGPSGAILIGGPDNDRIVGGAGTDLAVFSGNRSSYIIVRNGNFVAVSGPDGIDVLTAVEVLHFDDATLDLAAALANPRTPKNGVLRKLPAWRPPALQSPDVR